MMDSSELHGVVWACLVPFVLLGLLVALLVLFSYRAVYRSMDVLLIALLPAMVFDAGGLVLVQAVLFIRDEPWGRSSCQVYTWAWLWLRLTELLLLLSLSLERVLMLHARRYKHRGSATVKLVAACCWLAAAVVAAIPTIGWGGLDVAADVPQTCGYMAYEIDHHYAVFLLVFEITTAFFALGCLADTFLHLRHFARHTKDLSPDLTLANGRISQADPVQAMPTDPWNRSSTVAAAYDSCRLVCIILMAVFIVNHIPHAVSIFVYKLSHMIFFLWTRAQSKLWVIYYLFFGQPWAGTMGGRRTQSIPSHAVVELRVNLLCVESGIVSDNKECYYRPTAIICYWETYI